jgi:hypothetical protein
LLKLTPWFLTMASLILLLGETSIPAPSIASGIKTFARSGGESQPLPVKMAADPVIKQAIGDVSAQQIRQTIEKLVTFGTRQTLSVNNPGAASSDKGIVAARNWIRSEFEHYSAQCGGCLEVKTDTFIQQPQERIPQPTEIQNVYAILRGADPARAEHIYLVTGHYDSRNSDPLNSTDPAPGANDDASGTAVSLECARVLSKHKFPATLVFLAVAGEEQGLNGSAHFAKVAKDAGWQLDGVLNNDIVGGNRTPGDTRQNENWVRVFSEGLPAAATDTDLRRIRATGGENDSSSRQLARYVREVSHAYDFGQFTPKLIFRRDRYLRGGDHMSFNEQGFAAVRFTEYREDFHHQHQTPRVQDGVEYGDLVKFVDFDYVATVARLNAATLASLAAAPPKPSQVQLLTNQLENNSKLNWQVSAGAEAYQVLWRDTTDADFPEENTTLTAQTTIEIQESKDNVIFGVRATDAQGHHSLIAVPQPVRERTPAGGS